MQDAGLKIAQTLSLKAAHALHRPNVDLANGSPRFLSFWHFVRTDFFLHLILLLFYENIW
jgi:hypothetical protein